MGRRRGESDLCLYAFLVLKLNVLFAMNVMSCHVDGWAVGRWTTEREHGPQTQHKK